MLTTRGLLLFWLALGCVHSSRLHANIQQRQASALNNVFRFEPISLMEEPPIGTLVVDLASKLEINDLATSEFKFRFYSPQSQAAHYFMIDQLTGQVKTQRSIDREYLCETKACGPCGGDSYTNCTLPIEIVAAASSTRGQTSPGSKLLLQQKFVSFDVVIEDKNEFAPEFSKSGLLINISENTPANFTIPIEPATDRDSRPVLITYRLEPVVNDATTDAAVYEDQLRKLNSRIRLTPTQTSSGQSNSAMSQLAIVLIEPFDYEADKEFAFKIVASDQGDGGKSQEKQLTGTCLVTLNIVDVNDNLPVFDRQEYEYRLDEDKAVAGTRLIRVHATDRDDGLNGAVKYSLIDQTITTSGAGMGGSSSSPFENNKQQTINIKSLFQIDETSGWITVAPNTDLNYELLPTYRLTVRAQDSGPSGSSMPVFTNVIIHLNDVNDNAPQISLNLPDTLESPDESRAPLTTAGFAFDSVLSSDLQIINQLDVSEWTMPDTFLAQIILTDQDSGLNGKIRVDLAQIKHKTKQPEDTDDEWSSSDMFSLVHLFNNIYALVSKQAFDRESNDQYSLNITACDLGQPNQLCSTYNLLVVIKDENDNTPNFVAHNTHGGVTKNENGQIASITFNVLESDSLDASRGGNGSQKSDEWIIVGQVRAHDKDLHDNGRVTYEMALVSPQTGLNGSIDQVFQMDANTGLIRARLDRLDREAIEDYEFKVTARDGCDECSVRNKAAVQLFVHLIDVNDNEPRFERPDFKYKLNENMRMSGNNKPGHLVDRIRAHDADKPNTTNSKIKYRLIALDNEPVDELFEHFQVDANTGDLYLLKALDFETAPFYRFGLLAYNEAKSDDKRIEGLSTRCTVEVSVVDLNDNAPVLNSPTDQDLPLFFSLDSLRSRAGAGKHSRAGDKKPPRFQPNKSDRPRTPDMSETAGETKPPLLYKLSLFKVNASDLDSAENAKLTFGIEKILKLAEESGQEALEDPSNNNLNDQYDEYSSYDSYEDHTGLIGDLSPQEKQLHRLFECDRNSGQVYLKLRSAKSVEKSVIFRRQVEAENPGPSGRANESDFIYDPSLTGVYGLVVRISDGYFISRAYVFMVLTKEPFSAPSSLGNATNFTSSDQADGDSLSHQVDRLRKYLAQNRLNAMSRPFTTSASVASIPESNLFVDDDHKASYKAFKAFVNFFKPSKSSLTLNKQNNRISNFYDRYDDDNDSATEASGLLSRMGIVRLKNQILAAFSGKNYKYFIVFSVTAILMACFILFSLCMSVYLFKRRKASNKILHASVVHSGGTLNKRLTLKHDGLADHAVILGNQDAADFVKSTSGELSSENYLTGTNKSAGKRLKKYQKSKPKATASLSSTKPLLNMASRKMKNSSTSNCSASGDEFDGAKKYTAAREQGSSSETTNIIDVSSVSPTSSKLIQFQSSSSNNSSTPHSPASLNLYKYDVEPKVSSEQANFNIVYKKCLRAEYKEYTLPKQHNAVVTTTACLNQPKTVTLLRNPSMNENKQSTFLTAPQFNKPAPDVSTVKEKELREEDEKLMLLSNSNSPTANSSSSSYNGLASNRTDTTSTNSKQAIKPTTPRLQKHLVASAESLTSDVSLGRPSPKKPTTTILISTTNEKSVKMNKMRSPPSAANNQENQRPHVSSPVNNNNNNNNLRTFKSSCSPGQRTLTRPRTAESSNYRTMPVNGYSNMLEDQGESSSEQLKAIPSTSLLIEAPQEQLPVVTVPPPSKSPKLLIRNNNLFQFKSNLNNFPGPQAETPSPPPSSTNVPDYFFKDEKEYRKFLATNNKQMLNCKQIISTPTDNVLAKP